VPTPIRFLLHIYAALAEKERALITRRTKDALAAAKARGVVIGGLRDKGRELHAEALDRAEALRPVFAELAGLSHRALAKGHSMVEASTPPRAAPGARCKASACANGLAFERGNGPPGDPLNSVPST
jgi:hypothetical protein